MSPWRPGQRRPDRDSMIRVDQAGEYGATRIYAGQLAVLRRNSSAAKLITRMADIEQFQAEELEHRDVARDAGAAQAVGYPLLTAAIRAGCRVAIGLSKRI